MAVAMAFSLTHGNQTRLWGQTSWALKQAVSPGYGAGHMQVQHSSPPGIELGIQPWAMRSDGLSPARACRSQVACRNGVNLHKTLESLLAGEGEEGEGKDEDGSGDAS